jgi:hypothetical protein
MWSGASSRAAALEREGAPCAGRHGRRQLTRSNWGGRSGQRRAGARGGGAAARPPWESFSAPRQKGQRARREVEAPWGGGEQSCLLQPWEESLPAAERREEGGSAETGLRKGGAGRKGMGKRWSWGRRAPLTSAALGAMSRELALGGGQGGRSAGG